MFLSEYVPLDRTWRRCLGNLQPTACSISVFSPGHVRQSKVTRFRVEEVYTGSNPCMEGIQGSSCFSRNLIAYLFGIVSPSGDRWMLSLACCRPLLIASQGSMIVEIETTWSK